MHSEDFFVCHQTAFKSIIFISPLDWRLRLGNISASFLLKPQSCTNQSWTMTWRRFLTFLVQNIWYQKRKELRFQRAAGNLFNCRELMHLKVFGTVKRISVGGRAYALGNIDNFMAYSTVFSQQMEVKFIPLLKLIWNASHTTRVERYKQLD